ncbi:hypothetical protein ACEE90_12570 [Corynebacterium phoceense]|uniref:hypothetical protein n=1 Tax=Corynebacterium phoceense TaxID=1686286 RepID=UPI00211C4B5B|nr:hypothetical protein [Corynebacterium phoceense]MCQ9345880.1 hypothetical protein [Corynebacterium phoceense]
MNFVLTLVVLLAALIVIANVARLATLAEETSELAQDNVTDLLRVETDIVLLNRRIAALEMDTPLTHAQRIRHVLETPHDTESEAV